MFLRKKIIALLCLLLSWNAVSAQYSAVFDIPFPKQYQAIDAVIDTLSIKDTVTALKALKQMGAAATKINDELTQLNYQRSALRYRYIRIYYSPDSAAIRQLVTDAEQLLASVDENKYPIIAALIHVNIGNTLNYKTYQYNAAFGHYLRAYQLFKNVSVQDYPDRQYSQYSIALAYYQFNDFKNALLLANEIESLYPQKNYISAFTINLIGMSWLKLAQYDSAMHNFQWILENYKRCGMSVAWEGIISGNIGKIYFLQNEWQKAIPWLEKGVAISMEHNIQDNVIDFAAPLSTIYLQQNNLALAKKYVEMAQQAANKADALFEYYITYDALASYYKKTGNNLLALRYLDSSIIFKDRLSKQKDINIKYQAEMEVEKEKIKGQEIKLQNEKSRQVLIRNGLFIFIFLLLLIALLYVNSTRVKNQNREQQLLAQKLLAEAELNSATVQLKGFTDSIVEKNELIEKASAEIEQLNASLQKLQPDQYGKGRQPGETEDYLKQLQESVILTEEDWKSFTALFDKVYPGFRSRLKEKFPDVSPSENRFFALSKLKLSNKEMAAMMGISTDAIRQSRSRLKKKLGLAEEGDMVEIIDKI